MNTDARHMLMRAAGIRSHRPEDVSLEELRAEFERFPDYYNETATSADTIPFN